MEARAEQLNTARHTGPPPAARQRTRAHCGHRSSASPNRFSQGHSLPFTPYSASPCTGAGMHENMLSTLYRHLLEWSILATRLAVGVTRRLAPNNHAFPTTPASYLGSVHLLAEICFWMSCPMMKPGIVHTHVAQKPSFFLQQTEEKRAKKHRGNRGEETTALPSKSLQFTRRQKCEWTKTTAVASTVLGTCQALL